LEWTAITAILGIGLIYNMSQVYRFRAAPGWNTWRTNAGFIVSTLLLGISVMAPVLAYESNFTGIKLPSTQWSSIYGSVLILLLVQLTLTPKPYFMNQLTVARNGLLVLGIAAIAASLLIPIVQLSVISIPIFLSVFSEEVVGRWIFYASRLLHINNRNRTSIYQA
jgi:DMSO reductase anchor subunit